MKRANPETKRMVCRHLHDHILASLSKTWPPLGRFGVQVVEADLELLTEMKRRSGYSEECEEWFPALKKFQDAREAAEAAGGVVRK